jgi:hypothetical protein
MATRGQVLDRVTDMMEMKDTTTRTRLEPWVAFVLQEMKQEGILGPETTTTVTLVAGTASYNLPTDIDQIDHVFVEDSVADGSLIFKPEWELADEAWSYDDDEQGTPVYYTIPKRPIVGITPTIRFWPIPNAAGTCRINYQSNFQSLSADATVLQLKDDLFTTAVLGVYRFGVRYLEDGDDKQAREDYRISLAKARMSQWGRVGRVYSVKPGILA